MKTRLSVLAVAAIIAFATSAAMAGYKIKITPHPDGGYVSSLVDAMYPAKNIDVGRFSTKKEARQAAKEKKKELESEENGETGQ